MSEANSFISKDDAFNKFQESNPAYWQYLKAEQEKRDIKALKKEERMQALAKTLASKANERNKRWARTLLKRERKEDMLRAVFKERTILEAVDFLGLSRQRGYQLVAYYKLEYKKRTPIYKTPLLKKCEHCGDDFDVRNGNKKQKHCTRRCFTLARIARMAEKFPKIPLKPRSEMTYEERKMYNNARTKLYYHTHLKGTERFKEITALRNKKYDQKRLERLETVHRKRLEEKLKELNIDRRLLL